MATYSPENVILKNKKECIIRSLHPADAIKYSTFSELIAEESTHTLHFKGQNIPLDKIEEKWRISAESTYQLELGGFDQDKLISHLSFYKPRPYHPFEQHIGEFGVKVLREYWFHGVGSKMLEIAEITAKKMGVKRLQATVRSLNNIGINFYCKHGFEIEGMKKNAVLIDGSYQNELYIAKFL